VNRLNRYTSRTVPGYVGVSGEVAEVATVDCDARAGRRWWSIQEYQWWQ